MKIIIESPHFQISDSLTDFITERVARLAKLNHHLVCIEVNLTREGSGSKEKKVCTIILSQKGKDYVVNSKSVIFDDAVSKAVDVMMKRLRREKRKKLTARMK